MTTIIGSRVTMIGDAGRSASGHKMAMYLCACGKQFSAKKYSVDSGRTKSCGCYHREVVTRIGATLAARSTVTHGKSKTPEYFSWNSMLRRCRNDPYYAGRVTARKLVEMCNEGEATC